MKNFKFFVQKTLIVIILMLISLLIGTFNNKVIGYTQESPAPKLSKVGYINPSKEYTVVQNDLWNNKYLYCIQPDVKIPSGINVGYRSCDSRDVISWDTSGKTIKNNRKYLDLDNDEIWKLGYFIATEADKNDTNDYKNWDEYKKTCKIQNMVWRIVNGKDYYDPVEAGTYIDLESEYSFTWPMENKSSEKVNTTIKNRKEIKINSKDSKMTTLENVGIDLKNMEGLNYSENINNDDYYAVGPYKISKSIRR